ncbi:hypothetical protein FHX47_001235 [Garicola koreensis]|uniref:Uncharacterized protein n=1 Tax=Garicola koreensis TaxID=1262554 RepID=A0A7W5TQ34_9MICC|nr:hypothetical protein [Garicola koreensis]
MARAIVNAITADDDAQLTEIQIRPRQEHSWKKNRQQLRSHCG